jgi:hypothetical protein
LAGFNEKVLEGFKVQVLQVFAPARTAPFHFCVSRVGSRARFRWIIHLSIFQSSYGFKFSRRQQDMLRGMCLLKAQSHTKDFRVIRELSLRKWSTGRNRFFSPAVSHWPALVCKSWHPIGIQPLWSHVRLIVNKSAETSENMLSTLRDKPYLGTLVKRLTIRAQTAPYNGREERENSKNLPICSIIKYLLHINVLTCPSTYSIPNHLARPSVAMVYRGPSKTKPATSVNRPVHYGHFEYATGA